MALLSQMYGIGGKFAEIGQMTYLPSISPTITDGNLKFIRSGVVDSIANYPEFPSWLTNTGAG